jgi:glycosyltransferase involved in cell wall biosynthesis
MRILMLGWEFPPFVAGGLGTACQGLTKALAAQGHEIIFILPKSVGGASGGHVSLLGSDALPRLVEDVRARAKAESAPAASRGILPARETQVTLPEPDPTQPDEPEPAPTRFFEVEAGFSSPYPQGDARRDLGRLLQALSPDSGGSASVVGGAGLGEIEGLRSGSAPQLLRVLEHIAEDIVPEDGGEHHYGGDLFTDAQRYAKLVCALAAHERFDVIHAHDWLTYPAGMALKALTGKPLVAHVHATEFDRSGENVNQGVYDIERSGMHAADRVITVSRLTKSIAVTRYGADPAKVDVVYNGVEQEGAQPRVGKIERKDKIVLFLGRITMQKGPEYFIQAAKRVLEKIENVKFVVAGSGDMAVRMIEQAAALGIGHKVLFTGFLRGRDVDNVFRMADIYVMPSVSEPFGIAPLEAMSHDVPVIISKQSGVSEVLTHALKVDFWDTDEMANKIVAVLKYPPLSQTLRQHGEYELRGLTWGGAAEKCVKVYGRAIAGAM